ncbi:MAG: tetratricopeptide repeat protein [Magnetococcales bacterium]|nr:tetratricopeptide repeat protein [Magnetococcales bacterium]
MAEQQTPDTNDKQQLKVDEAYLLAIEHFNSTRFYDADILCSAIIKKVPNHIDAINLLGLIAQKINRYDLALEQFQRAINIDPNIAILYYNMGTSLYQLDRKEESVSVVKKSISMDPNYPEAYSSIGNTLTELGELDEAVENLQKAITIKPDFADAHYNLAIALKKQGKWDEAVTHFQKATNITPHFAACFNLANTFRSMGKLDEAVISYQKAIAIDHNSLKAHSNLLLCSQYLPGQSMENLFLIHKKWGDSLFCESNPPIFSHYRNITPDRPLRVGLLSPDYRLHPIGYFMAGFFKYHQVAELEIICYSDSIADELTNQLESYSDSWIFTKNFSDDQLSKQIIQDRIDILIDLAGHTENNRLQLFAKKLAPIQITWAGYVGTTGLKTMDWLIADHHYIAKDEDRYYTESIIRMPDSWVCYTPPTYVPEVAPQSANRFVLGNFGNPDKINEKILAVWAKILLLCPNTDLHLIYKGMDSSSNMQRINGFFANAGINTNRIILEGRIPHKELLARYNSIDLALDTIPYSGGLTTMEALWMGVPVVTTRGATFAGRHSTSILNNVGLDELVTNTLEEYLQLVIDLVSNPDKVKKHRVGLRNKIANSPLCDHKKFTVDLTKELRKVWVKWCEERQNT